MLTAQITPTRDAFALWHRVQDFGGFTVDPDTGSVPTSGYVVSLPDYERVYSREDFRPADVVHALQQARDVSQLYSEHHVYAGAWVSESGLVYTDASVVFEDIDSAARYARVWDQQAFYDVANETSIYVVGTVPAAA
jgi:hypothetical protein